MNKNEAQKAIASVTPALGVYRHWKGHNYVVFCFSVMESQPDLVLVHYYSLNHKTRWTRTVDEWNSRSEDQTEPGPRFEHIGPASFEQLLEAAGIYPALGVTTGPLTPSDVDDLGGMVAIYGAPAMPESVRLARLADITFAAPPSEPGDKEPA